jgi:hypothetical protein
VREKKGVNQQTARESFCWFTGSHQRACFAPLGNHLHLLAHRARRVKPLNLLGPRFARTPTLILRPTIEEFVERKGRLPWGTSTPLRRAG